MLDKSKMPDAEFPYSNESDCSPDNILDLGKNQIIC